MSKFEGWVRAIVIELAERGCVNENVELKKEIDRLLEIKKTLSLQAAGLLTENERLRLELDNAKAAIEQARDALSGWNEESLRR